MGIGFAISSNRAKIVADQLIATGKVTNSGRAYMGVQLRDGTNGPFIVAVTAGGDVLVNKLPVAGHDVEAIAQALKHAGGEAKDPVIIINADAKATHQSVIDVMQASQQSGYVHISFATQQPQH